MIIEIAPVALVGLFSHGNEVHMRVADGIKQPDDYELIDARMNERGYVALTFKHKNEEQAGQEFFTPQLESLHRG